VAQRSVCASLTRRSLVAALWLPAAPPPRHRRASFLTPLRRRTRLRFKPDHSRSVDKTDRTGDLRRSTNRWLAAVTIPDFPCEPPGPHRWACHHRRQRRPGQARRSETARCRHNTLHNSSAATRLLFRTAPIRKPRCPQQTRPRRPKDLRLLRHPDQWWDRQAEILADHICNRFRLRLHQAARPTVIRAPVRTSPLCHP